MTNFKVKSLEWFDIMSISDNYIYRHTNNDKGKYKINGNKLSIYWDTWGIETFIHNGNNEYYKERNEGYLDELAKIKKQIKAENDPQIKSLKPLVTNLGKEILENSIEKFQRKHFFTQRRKKKIRSTNLY